MALSSLAIWSLPRTRAVVEDLVNGPIFSYKLHVLVLIDGLVVWPTTQTLREEQHSDSVGDYGRRTRRHDEHEPLLFSPHCQSETEIRDRRDAEFNFKGEWEEHEKSVFREENGNMRHYPDKRKKFFNSKVRDRVIDFKEED
ncbi:hypothetical protein VNO77_12270 [Canavalia gladiata]|uniref:Uncharacterized protein n=1 Tax=Canavalia gladiata TaxID=3824 RepID=A0AAN9QUB1_CANGL